MNFYTFEIRVRENGKPYQKTWTTKDFAEANNEKEALEKIDAENDRLGYYVVEAVLVDVKPITD